MNEPTTYEIVVRGKATERLLQPLLDEFDVDYPRSDRTRLIGVVRDPAHLHGVMAHLTSRAIEVISLAPTGPPPLDNSNQASKQTTDPDNERHDQ